MTAEKIVAQTRGMPIDIKLLFHSRPDADTGCEVWIGPLVYGYGTLMHDGVQYRAHRVAYELAFGPIPDGFLVCHRCDNRACINPKHFFLGTHLDNMADMTEKERQERGEDRALAKLTEEKVREIRRDPRPDAALAVIYGVDHSLIHRVRMMRAWKHVLPTADEIEAEAKRQEGFANRGKLTSDQARSIRLDMRSGPALAREYGVDKALINRIKQRKAWAHVT